MKEQTNRPDIKPEWSFIEKILQILCPLIFLTGIVLLIASWGSLPVSVPTHFNAAGIPDSYGSKIQLILTPLISAGIYLMITVFERFPRIINFPVEITEENARYEYQAGREMMVCLKTETIGVFTYILWRQIEAAKRTFNGMGYLFLIVTLVLIFGTMAIYIIKMFRHRGYNNTNGEL